MDTVPPPSIHWSSLRYLVRLWLARSTGILSVVGDPSVRISLVDGGLVSLADAVLLSRVVRFGGLQLLPGRPAEVGDRWLSAQVIREVAIEGVAADLPHGAGPPQLRYLFPEDQLQELGFVPGAFEATLERTEWLGRALAMDRLGLASVWFSGVPLGACADAVEEDDVVYAAFGLEASDAERRPNGSDDPRVEAGLRSANAYLVRGHWVRAERVLAALVDIRLDDARVLAMLAMVKAADADRLDFDRLVRARQLARLAAQLGAASIEATELVWEAQRSVERAEAFLAAEPQRHAAGMPEA